MKKFIVNLVISLALVSAVSCQPKEKETLEPDFSPVTESITAAPEGGQYELLYTLSNPVEGVEVKATSAEDWIDGFVYEDSKVLFDVAPNTADSSRKGTVSLTYGTIGFDIPVTQYASGTEEPEEKILLDEQMVFNYIGDIDNSSTYYLAMTNLEYEGSPDNFFPTSEGYLMTIVFFGQAGTDWSSFPTGTFEGTTDLAPQTYVNDPEFSNIIYVDADGNYTELQLSGDPVTIVKDDNTGYYTVSARFTGTDGIERDIIYTGELNVQDVSSSTTLPLIGDDVVFDGVAGPDDELKGGVASAVYSGDIFGVGSGVLEVLMYDIKGSNNLPNGYAMTVTLFTPTFTDDVHEITIPEGTYNVGQSMELGTALAGGEMEIPAFAIVVPMGTYVAYDDQTKNGQYSFAESGTVTITMVGDKIDKVYHFEFDMISSDGHTITGEFEGPISVSNEAEDDGNDGSTNLDRNVEMDLSYLPSASCYPRDEIYVGGLGVIPVESIWTGQLPGGDSYDQTGEACSYQVIDIGTGTGYYEKDPTGTFPETGKLREGDVIRLDLLVEPGKNDCITTGTYTITPNRYPAQMKPGVCVRGYTGANGTDGTRYLNIVNVIGNGYPYGLNEDLMGNEEYFQIDGPLNLATINKFACLYEGTVTISKAQGPSGEDNWYTFEIDGKDVIKHTIKGTWTGPVWLNGNTSTPVQTSFGTFMAGNTGYRQIYRIGDMLPYIDVKSMASPLQRMIERTK